MPGHPDDVNITFCLTAELSGQAVRDEVEQLSAAERERHARFHFARDRRDYGVAHALLRRALSARGNRAPRDWRFVSTGKGKPVLAPESCTDDLSFNLTHTDGLVACVVARDAALGIDVEAIDRKVGTFDVARRFFSSVEVAALERCPAELRQQRFIEIWTLKEAYVKALGEGLSCPLQEFAFVFEGKSALRFESRRPPAGHWRFALFAPSDRHRLAVAVGSQCAGDWRLTVCDERRGRSEAAETIEPLRDSINLTSISPAAS